MKAERLPEGQRNVFGDPIETCCVDPMTGYFRDGSRRTGLTISALTRCVHR